MSSSYNATISPNLSTAVIVASVIGTLGGVACCIGAIVVIICAIKHCNKPRNSVNGGMVLQPYPSYPPSNAPYQPYTLSNPSYQPYSYNGPNNPPPYVSANPPQYSQEKPPISAPTPQPRPTSEARFNNKPST